LNQETVLALAAVNRRFYRERASEFSASRERPWSAWSELFARIGESLPASPVVLDVGCGNGRFARFLEECLPRGFTYYGVDESPLALEHARARLPRRENVVLVEHDFIGSESALPALLKERRFDLVVLFGVVHHVPGSRTREALLGSLSGSVAPGGFFAYTLWRFDRHERFRNKIVPWTELEERSGISIDLAELEPGDHVLTWGGDGPAYRYCHAVTDEEAEALASSLPLTRAASFEPDREPNTYYLMKNPPLDESTPGE
jgi:SAM-dependent methyltransferase